MTAMKTVRYVLWAAVAVVVAGAAAIFVINQLDEDSPPANVASIGGPFSLTDQHGETVTEADLKGHPSAMFFGYTFCPEVCPTTLLEMTSMMEKLGPDADKLKVYFVTVDPERDTQSVLAEYLQAFDPRIVGLTGSREAIDQALSAYRVFSRKVERDKGPYLMDHTAGVYLLNSDGTFTGTIAYQEDEETAMAKLKRLVGRS
ncbi:MAG: SCO family protein [Bauldia sp.]|uniref:SCO family protein n=1 Tax=Bauldia sp. TaxID=2575872 RepID=UPI001DB053CE|nr:SCO family protein [Bauldia sp.]MCB1494574.1 SCO family protein [Bauldia sp.]